MSSNVLLKRSTILHYIVGDKGSCVPGAIYTAPVLTPIQIVFPDLNSCSGGEKRQNTSSTNFLATVVASSFGIPYASTHLVK